MNLECRIEHCRWIFRWFVVIFLFFILHSAFSIPTALAQGVPLPSQIQTGAEIAAVPGQAGLILPTADPRVIVARIIRVALGFLGLVAVALILYGGFLWLTSAGNEEQIDKAKKVLVNSVIGLAIILSAFGIVQFVLNRLQLAAGGPLTIPADVRCPGPDCPFLPSDAFIVRRIAPSGAVPIRNIVVRVFFSGAPDPETLAGNLNLTRKDSGAAVALEPAAVVGNIVELRPSAACPEPNQDRRCFDADTEFVVQIRDGADGVKRFDGRDLLCGGFAPTCRVEFRSGSIIDVAPPEVTIESPDDGAAVEVDTCVPVQVRVKDDGGVEHVEIYADGTALLDGLLTPPEGTYPLEIILTLPCFPANPPAPAQHQLRARAFDIDDNAVWSAPVRVIVRPSHCFNRDQLGFPLQDDDEDGPNCDSAADGPSGCGLCDGSSCTDNIQCSGGVCTDLDGDGDKECTTPLTITGISPGDGKAGTLVTVAGLNFGQTPGAAFFHNGVRAQAPEACAGNTTWSDNYILVGLPEGAQVGPVTVVADGCADNDNLCRDTSNDSRGPIVPVHPPPRGSSTPTGLFEVNEVEHPGICSVNPIAGLWNAPVNITGVQFGEQTRRLGKQILRAQARFGGQPGAVDAWSATAILSRVPALAFGPTQVQVENTEKVPSNALPFTVLSPDAGTLPIITTVVCAGAPEDNPARGGPGAGCTISGRNFGDTPGMVWFVTSDGRGVQGNVDFPSQCGSSWWSPIQITVKVPRILDIHDADEDGSASDLLFDDGAYLYVQRYDRQQSSPKDFDVLDQESAAPFLACIEPASGPTFTNVSIFGDRFGSAPASGRGALFTARRSSADQSWAPTLPATLTNVGGIRLDACPRGGWDAQEVCAQVPGNTVAGTPAGEVIIQNDFPQAGGGQITRASNLRTFLVGDCRLPAPDEARLDCAALGGLTCCGDGTCRADCAGAQPGESAFAWQFTTSQAPLTPTVFEGCDKAADAEGFPQYPPSPSPAVESGRGSNTGVCVNAAVAVSFNPDARVDPATLNSQTIKLQKCTAPTELLNGADTTFGSPNFTADTAVWGRPPEPTLDPPTNLRHEDLLGVETVLGAGRGASSADPGNFALALTKLDNDTGPGWRDTRGLQQNYEHWFGYQANAIADTSGKIYTATAWMKAVDAAGAGKRAGILIQRAGGADGMRCGGISGGVACTADTGCASQTNAGQRTCLATRGFWQKVRSEITLTNEWQPVSVTMTFDASPNGNAPGYVRVFLEGDPYEVGEEASSGEDFAVYVDDVQIEGEACSQVEDQALGRKFGPYSGGLGFSFWLSDNFSAGSWYRVVLLGGTGGITAQDRGALQGQPMIPLPDGLSRCGDARAAYCFAFQTKNESNPDNNLCQVGGIAVVPSPYEATTENEPIDYLAIPVALDDPCVVPSSDDYSWAWDVYDTENPERAAVTYNSSGISPAIGKACSEDAECAIGYSHCSNNYDAPCQVDADCGGQPNTCVTEACVGGYCKHMPWTVTVIALEDTQGEEIRVRAHTPPQPPRTTGFGKLKISFMDPQVIQWWPACGEACTNAKIAARFNVAMFTSSNTLHPQSVTNVQNALLWAVPCGNGSVETGEECDDGNTTSGDGCSAVCLNEGSNFSLRCGDGRACRNASECGPGESCQGGRCLDRGEDCDDGNLENGDGCSSQCLNEGTGPALCGNGKINPGEECDNDRNRQAGDGCSAQCLREGTSSNFAVCGNSRLEAGEECEVNFDHEFASWCDPQDCLRRGNPVSPLLCGNGQIDPGEECDPNSPLLNTPAKRNLCTSICQWTGTRRPSSAGGQGCGNGRIELGEDCDDGNLRPGDGCSEVCVNEGSIAAGSVPACGDGILASEAEDCDDGNTNAGDGCSPNCLNEGTRFAQCGNGLREYAEDCDDGNRLSGDGCLPQCLNEGSEPALCGNGVLDNGEDIGCDGGERDPLCTVRCLKPGRLAERVLSPALSWKSAENTLEIGLTDNPATSAREDLLLPNTFYRVLLKGGSAGLHSSRRDSSVPGKPLAGLNFSYNWAGRDAITGAMLAPGPGKCAGAQCNTFSWTFKTGASSCQVDRVELSPPQAALYLIGARASFSAEPRSAPDACDPQGQRLNSLSYDWGWKIDDPELEEDDRVAGVVGNTMIAGVVRTGVDRLPSCGNGVREYAEDCDDGNLIDGDGCLAQCLNEGSSAGILGRFACGNGIIDPGEECDPPGLPGCTASCLHAGALARCVAPEQTNCCGSGGDPEPGNGEDCDDGNVLPGDGCSTQCRNEGTSRATTCGNGQIDRGEECDPEDQQRYRDLLGAPLLSEFCDPATCLLKGTLPVSTCGNGLVEAGEECDQLNNRANGDGCSSRCLNEGTPSPFCGNGRIDRFEDCDDGNTAAGDGCSARCLNEGTVAESPRRIDPIQQARALGIRKFCRKETGEFKEPRAPCSSNGNCTDENFPVCAPPNPWSTVAVEAAVEGQAGAPGSASITVFCVARSEADCPTPGQGPSEAVGRGSDNCCYLRPKIVERVPGINTPDACPNGLLEVTFDQPMDSANLDQAIGIAKRVENTATCPDGLTLQGRARNSVWCADPSLSLKASVESAAQGSRLVLQPSRILDNATDYQITIAGDPNLNDLIASGVRSIFGVAFRGPAAEGGTDSSWNFTTGSEICTVENVRVNVTGADEAVSIFEGEGGAGFSRPGQQAQVRAEALSSSGQALQRTTGYSWAWSWRSAENTVASVTNEPDPINAADPINADPDQTVTAGNRNGETDVNATATITDASALPQPEDHQDAVREGSAEFITTLCENPWPSRIEHPLPRFEDREGALLGGGDPMNFRTWYCRDSGEEGLAGDLPALIYPGAIRPPAAGADEGAPVTLDTFRIATSHTGPAPLKEYLLVESAEKQQAIGIRVFPNPRRLPVRTWYEQMGFTGTPAPINPGVDGYEAIRDRNTVYVAGTNAVTDRYVPTLKVVYSNIYVLSLSENAPSAMQQVFDQFVSNFQLNVNVENSNRDKLRRDLLRLNHISSIQSALEDYRNTHGRYPPLQAGTFIRSMSTSKWPSWQATLGATLGASLPQDPLNSFAPGCAAIPGERGQFDPATCWNEQTQTYRCPAGSHVYQYRAIGAVDYELGVDFELLYRPPAPGQSRWEVFNFDPAGTNLLTPSNCSWVSAPGAPAGGLWSNATATCGNGILERGECLPDGTCANYPGVSCGVNNCQEFCEVGQEEVQQARWFGYCGDPGAPFEGGFRQRCNPETGVISTAPRFPDSGSTCTLHARGSSCVPLRSCSLNPSKECVNDENCADNEGVCILSSQCQAVRACTNRCEWNDAPQVTDWQIWGGSQNPTSNLDICQGGVICGNGIREGSEVCDDGLLNGQYGKCNTVCARTCIGGPNQGNICTEDNNCFPWGQCSATALSAYCGDGTRNGPEVCDSTNSSGAACVNGDYGCCRFDCSGPGARCGDNEIQEEWNEQCEAGDTRQSPQVCMWVWGASDFGKPCRQDSDCDTSFGSCKFTGPIQWDGTHVYDSQQFTEPEGYPYLWRQACRSGGPCRWGGLTTVAQGQCGNGAREGNEQCDDGTTNDGQNDAAENADGCINDCKHAKCGDGFNQGLVCVGTGDRNRDGVTCRRDQDCGRGRCTDPEECDEGTSNGTRCTPGYGLVGCTYCDNQCNISTLSGGVLVEEGAALD
ncbi:DUF4215 domain-containing protein [Candidatus Uhrbacteria bacterium]|nr:DUF4215 domain-containing protein [Candidatus Uhrbacteria bacterium]